MAPRGPFDRATERWALAPVGGIERGQQGPRARRKVPLGTVHAVDRETDRTLCGRSAAGWHRFGTWPAGVASDECSSCLQAAAEV